MDETGGEITLNFHEADVPSDLKQPQQHGVSNVIYYFSLINPLYWGNYYGNLFSPIFTTLQLLPVTYLQDCYIISAIIFWFQTITDFVCLEYAGDSTLYISDTHGQISAWDTRENTCFLHWPADNHEIGNEHYNISKK